MRRAALLGIVALVALPLAASAQQNWVRGEVTAVGGSSLTVTTAEGPMTFTVDQSTDIIAPGAGTATREAQKLGKAGATLDKIFKAGDTIEVHYTEAGGKMMASEIRSSGGAPTAPAEAKKGSSARGTVTAVSQSSITVKGRDAEWTFAVDQKTEVIGRGVGTAARELQRAGAAQTLPDFIKQNDEVTVRFTGKHADEIRLTRRAQ